MLCKVDQEVFVVKTFYSGGSCVAVERQYCQVSVNVALSGDYLVCEASGTAATPGLMARPWMNVNGIWIE
jgi:hypothetical protein